LTRTIRLSAAAQADIVDILEYSEAQFGLGARQRYEELVATALRDIAEEPDRPGSAARPELGGDIRSWHLRLSRNHAKADGSTVRRPRHMVLYTVIDETSVGVLRVLHDAMELHRHIGESDAFADDGD
jgi:toxin ParE1/3/4